MAAPDCRKIVCFAEAVCRHLKRVDPRAQPPARTVPIGNAVAAKRLPTHSSAARQQRAQPRPSSDTVADPRSCHWFMSRPERMKPPILGRTAITLAASNDGLPRSPAAWSALLLRNGRREVRILVRHPIHEFSHVRIIQQAGDLRPTALKLGIGEIGDQRLLADRVHWHDIAASAAFGHGMMPDDGLARRPTAKPTQHRCCRGLVVLRMVVMGSVFGILASHRRLMPDCPPPA